MKNIITFLWVSVFIISCANNPNSSNYEATKKEIQERWNAFIMNWEAENAKACSEFYTQTGKNIPPEGEIKKGRKAIEEFYTFLFNNNLSSKYNHQIKELEVSSNLAIEYGEFKVDWVNNDTSEWTFKGRSITQWKKDKSGIWEIEKFIFNNPPKE